MQLNTVIAHASRVAVSRHAGKARIINNCFDQAREVSDFMSPKVASALKEVTCLTNAWRLLEGSHRTSLPEGVYASYRDRVLKGEPWRKLVVEMQADFRN